MRFCPSWRDFGSPVLDQRADTEGIRHWSKRAGQEWKCGGSIPPPRWYQERLHPLFLGHVFRVRVTIVVLHLLCTFRYRFVEAGVIHNSGGFGPLGTIEGSKQLRDQFMVDGAARRSSHISPSFPQAAHQQTRLMPTPLVRSLTLV